MGYNYLILLASFVGRFTIFIDPRVHKVNLYSVRLGLTKTFYVFLPPGYYSPENLGERYPSLYLFRGHEREWVNLHEDGSRNGRSVVDTYLELYYQGYVGRMILIFPGTTSPDVRVPGMLINFKDPALANARGVGTGRWEHYFVEELMTYVDGQYRTLPSRLNRGVDGFSLGGFQSIKIAAQYPTLFSSAGSYDGTFFYASRDGTTYNRKDRLIQNPMFDPAFGRPRDPAVFAANNPANLIINARQEQLAAIFWMIQTGPQTVEPMDSNFYRGRYVVSLLEERGIPNRLPLVLAGGRHNWQSADYHLSQTLPFHYAVLTGRLDFAPPSPTPTPNPNPPLDSQLAS